MTALATPNAETMLVDMAIVDVTPAQAAVWLEANEVNRSLREKLVRAYRKDMEEGRWAFTAEPVQISRTGRLLNGQHRLTALAGSNLTSLQLMVVTGLDDHAQTMMDQGTGRSARDALVFEHGHIKNITSVASVCRWLVGMPKLDANIVPNDLRKKITAAQQVEVYNKHKDEIDFAVERATHLRIHITGSPSALAYTYLFLHRIDPDAAAEFFNGMVDMNWAYPNDPRKAALKRLQFMAREEATSLETGLMMVSVLTRAWNAWRKGEQVEMIMARGRKGPVPPVRPV